MPKRAYWEKCERGKLLRKVIAELPPSNVAYLWKGSEVEARIGLVRAGLAYCRARCGGCPLTEKPPPMA